MNTKLIAHETTSSFDYFALWGRPYAPVSHVRRVVFSRGLGYLLVEDRAASDRVCTYRQFWHLGEDAAPTLDGTTVLTHRARGNLMIRQALGEPALRMFRGALLPMIEGWRSYHYGDRIATPQVEAVLRAREAHYLTLLVPSAAGAPDAAIGRIHQMKDGFTAFVRLGRDVEQVEVRGARATVTARTDCPPAGPAPATPRLPAPLPACSFGDWA
ncbi:MAG: heparinase II/III family protein [Acidobacteria bacterium]|nr:heparinase II/III family protein [Acidobacteriota bacterium]